MAIFETPSQRTCAAPRSDRIWRYQSAERSYPTHCTGYNRSADHAAHPRHEQDNTGHHAVIEISSNRTLWPMFWSRNVSTALKRFCFSTRSDRGRRSSRTQIVPLLAGLWPISNGFGNPWTKRSIVFVQYQFTVICAGSELPSKPARLFPSKIRRTDRLRHHHSHGFLFALIH